MLVEQGDLIELDFDPALGHEPKRLRPALVVSVGFHNNVLSNLVMVCPITSSAIDHPLHVGIASGNAIAGRVCLEQLRSVDLASPQRSARALDAHLDAETMARVLDGLGGIFGI